MRSLCVYAVAMIASLIYTGCGDAGSGQEQRSHIAALLREQGGECSTLDIDRTVGGFVESLGAARLTALRGYLDGRFDWFSVTNWPRLRQEHVSYGQPQYVLRIVERLDGIPIRLDEAAVSGGPGGYVGVAFTGQVNINHMDRQWWINGKTAVNCDGSIRAWSMAVAPSDPEAGLCRGAPSELIDGTKFCRLDSQRASG